MRSEKRNKQRDSSSIEYTTWTLSNDANDTSKTIGDGDELPIELLTALEEKGSENHPAKPPSHPKNHGKPGKKTNQANTAFNGYYAAMNPKYSPKPPTKPPPGKAKKGQKKNYNGREMGLKPPPVCKQPTSPISQPIQTQVHLSEAEEELKRFEVPVRTDHKGKINQDTQSKDPNAPQRLVGDSSLKSVVAGSVFAESVNSFGWKEHIKDC